jgi:hypothetical protein
MRMKQLGISLSGLMVGAVIFIVLAMVGMKMGPSYLEFASIKKAVVAIAQEKPGASVVEVRKAFDARATIDAITTISGKDIEVTKEGGQLVVAAAYRKEIPLAGNLGVYIDFRAVSNE